ncbi:MAG: hypothetical protein VZS44_10375 [Bacilli bacterium]|nr:hypothetical protein [Bacilli bacterium]
MNKFGVCRCDNIDSYEPFIEELKQFDTYEEAYEYYMQIINQNKYSFIYPNNLWIVWIDDDKIVQFTQLREYTRCKIISIS